MNEPIDITAERTKRQKRKPKEQTGPVMLVASEKGIPLRHVENAIRILRDDRRWAGCLVFDDFAKRVVFSRRPDVEDLAKKEIGVGWEESDATRAAAWMLRHYGLGIGSAVALEAAVVVAETSRFHPVRQYLDGLKWDGVPRVENWLALYCGAESSPIVQHIGQWWLVSAVARIYRPGCQADHMLVLQGDQGIGKSSALRILGGDWYKSDLRDIENKDGPIGLFGKWIVEVSELASLRGKAIETVKQFVTTPSDHVRLPYGRLNSEHPRQCVFAGTTNDSVYLHDVTGARRFWPVSVLKIDREGLQRDRDQLWAEAMDLFQEGRPWWPTDEHHREELAVEADDRRFHDPWEERIAEWIQRCERSGNTQPVTTNRILADALDKEPGSWTRADEMRIGDCLRALKYERRRVTTAEGRAWGYLKKEGEDA